MSQEPNLKVEAKQAEPPVLTFSADGGDEPETPPASLVGPNTGLATLNDQEAPTQDLAQLKNPDFENRNTAPLPVIVPAQPSAAPPNWPTQPPPQLAYHQPPPVSPYQAQWQPSHPPMDAARYRYLTTPPPVVRQPKVKPLNTASQGGWWGGPVSSGSDYTARYLLAGAGIVAAVFLLFLFLNRPAVQPTVGVQSEIVVATATLISDTNGTAGLATPVVDLVTAQEKWGTVLVNSANVRDVPLETGNVSQKLKQNTLLAFEKKSSAGWYMLAGGGWIKREEVRVFTDQEAALAAVAQFQATATAAAAANPLPTTPTAAPPDNSSPAELSARGALTFQTANCNIKAEQFTSDGSKTYYLPSQAAYNSLSMLPPENHRWFCSEQDAAKNGYLRANSPFLPTPAPSPTFGVTQRLPTARPTTFGTPATSPGSKFLTPTPPPTPK